MTATFVHSMVAVLCCAKGLVVADFGTTAGHHKYDNGYLLNVCSAPYTTFAEPVNSGDSTPGTAVTNHL